MTKAFLIKALSVVCTAQDGYRRAGFVLKNGENILDGASITAEKYDMLNDDPRLTVSVIDDEDIRIPNGADLSGGDKTTKDDDPLKNHDPSRKPDDDGKGRENPTQNPPPDESALKLSQTCLAALAESDPLIYFNQDGSPRITKWREATGNELLTKEAVIASIELAKQSKE